MSVCAAAWLRVPSDELEWPSGIWHQCENEATVGRYLRLGENRGVILPLTLCEAHAQLFDETTGLAQVEVVVDE